MRGLAAIRLGVALGLVLGAGSAGATAFCEILPNADGFVALRLEPSAQSRLLRRLPVGDDVQLDETRAQRGNWQPVIYRGPERRLSIAGWVHRRLIEKECG